MFNINIEQSEPLKKLEHFKEVAVPIFFSFIFYNFITIQMRNIIIITLILVIFITFYYSYNESCWLLKHWFSLILLFSFYTFPRIDLRLVIYFNVTLILYFKIIIDVSSSIIFKTCQTSLFHVVSILSSGLHKQMPFIGVKIINKLDSISRSNSQYHKHNLKIPIFCKMSSISQLHK